MTNILGSGPSAGSPDEVLNRPARPPDLVVRYGYDVNHLADVHLPPQAKRPQFGTGGGPIFVIFIHGGFWRSAYGREHTAPLAEALAARGLAVCSPEYRRTGQVGGGWPGTFDDIALAVDRLPGLVAAATSGLTGGGRVVLAGHSAGGHLALWAASRHRLPRSAPWRSEWPLNGAVVALAAVSDLTACFDLRLGRGAAADLMGGGPERFPDRFAVADPVRLLPADAPIWLVHGTDDDSVPCQMSLDYAGQARAAGDDVICTTLPGTGHFEVIDPLSAAWPGVDEAFRLAAELD